MYKIELINLLDRGLLIDDLRMNDNQFLYICVTHNQLNMVKLLRRLGLPSDDVKSNRNTAFVTAASRDIMKLSLN